VGVAGLAASGMDSGALAGEGARLSSFAAQSARVSRWIFTLWRVSTGKEGWKRSV
jgi:hypothetical protein